MLGLSAVVSMSLFFLLLLSARVCSPLSLLISNINSPPPPLNRKVDLIAAELNSPLMGIACLCRRTVYIYQSRNSEYKCEKEIELKDVPLRLEWTKGKLFIGYKTKYSFVYVDTAR